MNHPYVKIAIAVGVSLLFFLYVVPIILEIYMRDKAREQLDRVVLVLLGAIVVGAITWCRGNDSPTIQFIGMIATFSAVAAVGASSKLESKLLGTAVGAASFSIFTLMYLALTHNT